MPVIQYTDIHYLRNILATQIVTASSLKLPQSYESNVSTLYRYTCIYT